MRCRSISFLGLSLICLLLAGGIGRAQQAQPTEYQIKAAFLFNFAKFVEWPPAAFAEATSPIVIGILGKNPYNEDLARIIRDKKVDDRPLVIKELRSPTETTNCHILFISTSEKTRLPQIIKSLRGTSVLTVGEMDRFVENGGMINFFLESGKIRFEINNAAATSAGLKISSRLLALASSPQH